jgi:hypothetical protein
VNIFRTGAHVAAGVRWASSEWNVVCTEWLAHSMLRGTVTTMPQSVKQVIINVVKCAGSSFTSTTITWKCVLVQKHGTHTGISWWSGRVGLIG